MIADGYAAMPFDAACDKPEQPIYLPLVTSQCFPLDGVPLALGELLADAVPRDAQDAPQAPPLASGSGPTAYALGALERATRAVAGAPEGNRNEVLNREAYGMGGFVASGQLSASVVMAALFDATQRAGYATPDADRRKIAEGVTAGMAKPRMDGLPTDGTHGDAANDEEEPADLIEVPIGDIMDATPPEPGFVIGQLVPRRVTTLLGGHGGLGKSMLGLTLCAHVAAGVRFASFDVAQARAVFVSLEDDAAIIRYRLRRIIPRVSGAAQPPGDDLRASADADAVLEVLRVALNAGLSVTTALSGPSTSWHTLSTLAELGAQYRCANGRRRVAAALVRLARDGRIVRTTYRKPDRHTGERWELPQGAAANAA